MGNYGKCKYCGSDIVVEIYKKHNMPRMIAYCNNEKCNVQPCTNDDIPSRVMEELKYFTEE